MTEKLLIGNEERDYLFCTAALVDFEDRTGRSILETINRMSTGSAMKLSDIVGITFSSLRMGARRQGKEFPHSLVTVTEWFDEPGVIARAADLFTAGLGKLTGEETTEEKEPAPKAVPMKAP